MGLDSNQMATAAAYLSDTNYTEAERVQNFYNYLSSNGEPYGDLGEAVSLNNSWQGEIANNFAYQGAKNNGGGFEHGSNEWVDLNYQLALRHYAAYDDNSGATPTRTQIQTYHNEEYVFAGLDADDWLPNKLLNDSADPDALWADYLTNDGAGDLIDDGFGILTDSGKYAFVPLLMYKALTNGDVDPSALIYSINLLEAFKGMSIGAKTAMAGDFTISPTLRDLADLIKDTPPGSVSLVPPHADGIDNPEGLLDGMIPDWMDGPLSLFGGAKDLGSPLVLDLDSDGIELTSFAAATTTTFFDIDGDGFAEQTAWVAPDDGLLVRDVNENGTIDDVTELFGSADVDGFAKLALLDTNGDSIINQYDDPWDDLLVWQDANSDAVSQSGELVTLASLGVVSIDLAGVQASSSTINGNPISHTSTFRYSNGTTDAIADAWFVHDDVNTKLATDYSLDLRALFLPTLRGFGNLPSLHVAMSDDATLLSLVEDLADDWTLPAVSNPADLQSDIEGILFRWAGVHGISTTSRGAHIDARRLEFMEGLFGDNWMQLGIAPNPGPVPSAQLDQAFTDLYREFASHLLVQLGWDTLFANDVSYNIFDGGLSGTFALSETGIDDLISPASQPGVDAEAYWLNVMQFIDVTAGLDNLTTQEEGWLDDAIYASDSSLTLQDLLDAYAGDGTSEDDTWSGTSGADTYDGGAGNDDLYGDSGDDLLYGNIGSDTLDGSFGNDTLYGGTGNDVLYGGYDGNDILHAGTGGDFVYGQTGNDIYYYTGGDDVYVEGTNNGSDRIKLPSGIEMSDLQFYRVDGISSYDSLIIEVGQLGSIEIRNMFTNGGDIIASTMELLEFDDTSTFTFYSDFTSLVTHGTDGDDFFAGGDGASDLADVMYGYGGDDELRGDQGNDTLDGGAGNDVLKGGGGDDTFVFSAGFDEIHAGSGFDTLVIPASYLIEDLAFFRDGSDLNIIITDFGQAKLDYQHYSNGYLSVNEIYFAENQQTIQFSAISIEQRGTEGNDSISGLTVGASQDDILNGMGGDDILYGKSGNDTYIFSEGTDRISDTNGADTLRFWEGWNPQDITVYRQKAYGSGWDDLILEDQSGNKMIVDDHFDFDTGSNHYQLEYVEFHDSTQWDILNMTFEIWGTAGAETISGFEPGAMTIRGFGGNDSIAAYAGSQYIDGGDGDDTISSGDDADELLGGAGADDLSGGSGADVIYGEDGDDILKGNDGDDVLYGGDGFDKYFGGNGADTHVLESASAYSDVDEIYYFSVAQNDVIDISDLLSAYDPLNDAITDFVQITDDGTDSTLAVDADGGADNFVAVASIVNATGLTDEASLESSGTLIAA